MRRFAPPLSRSLALLGALRRGTASDGLPYKLTLILNGNCPTRCSFCNIWKTPSPDEMTVAEWDRFFSSVPHTVWANLSGGEIFMRDDLPDLLDALVARMPRLFLVDFPTTGWFQDRALEACERLSRAGVPRVLVSVSLDGPPDLHDRLRGREGAHARACETMRALRGARIPGLRAYFGMTLIPENHLFVDQAVEAARQLVPGVSERDFHFNLGTESGHYYRNLGADAQPPLEALDALKRMRRKGFDVVSVLERAYQDRLPEYFRTGRSPVPCTAVRASVFVDPRGVVYPCTVYERPIGKLREDDYDLGRILRSGQAQRARRAVIDESCPGCWTPCEAYQALFARFTRSHHREDAPRRHAGRQAVG
jgi:MoaA/NifB/PqqE/SkfB family radical SAM enzyme